MGLSMVGTKKTEKGQVVVEYILLLVVVVAAASILISRLTNRDPQSPGTFISVWCEITKMIASDDPNSRTPHPQSAGCSP